MQGQRGLSTNSSEYNAQDFMIRQLIGQMLRRNPCAWSRIRFGHLPVGFVDVQPSSTS